MGAIKDPEPVMPLVTLFSRHTQALDWAEEKLSSIWGKPSAKSELFSFDQTSYYAESMGDDLKLCILAFERFIDPAELIEFKLRTNEVEREYAELGLHTEKRPLNIDPGYMTPLKFVLATTKDVGHRLYLGKGIYAEVTLGYMNGAWEENSWTYPNYAEEGYKAFLAKCRKLLLAAAHK